MKFLRKTLWAKLEVTYNVDPTPTKLANAVLAAEIRISPMVLDKVKRTLVLAHFGNQGQLIAGSYVQIEIDIEMAGSGAAGVAAAYGPFFKACAMSETVVADTSVTYAPIMTGESSITFYYNHDGAQHKITGARGSVVPKLSKLGRPIWAFKFIGLYNAPTAVAMATDSTLTAYVQPLMVNNTNTTFSLHGYAARMAEVSVDLGNKMIYRNLVGVEEIAFVDRDASANIVIEAPALGTKDYYAISKAGTSGALSVVHGITAGNIITIGAPAVVPLDIGETEVEGNLGLSFGADVKPTAAGNDEVTFTFT